MGERFRFIKTGIFGLIILGLFFAVNMYSEVRAVDNWTFVDGNASIGLNKDSSKHAVDPVMAVFNNELYVAWTENCPTPVTTQIRVKKYNGSTWSWVDGGGTTGINYSTSESANGPYLYVFNNNLYCIWSELATGSTVTRIKRYDGGNTWTSIDPGGNLGLNKLWSSSCNPTLGVCNGNLYAAWVETFGGVQQLRVKQYLSGTTWQFVDGGSESGLNIDTNRSANYPKLLSLNNQLYLIWTELDAANKSQIRVKRYDGGSMWTIVDGGSGLNYNSGYDVSQARPIIYNNTLYAYWLENYRVRVKSYNGSAWSTADNNVGYLQNNGNYCYPEVSPAAIPYNNKLYFTWGEDISYSPWSIQIRAGRYFNGAMTMIDGDSDTAGLNFNRLKFAYKPSIIEYNGELYIAWYETNTTANQVRVRKTPLPAIVTSVAGPADGSYGVGQNLDFTVAFNKAVNVTGNPTIPITLNSGTVFATYYSGSGTANLTFRYTITPEDSDPDGIGVGTDIALSTGNIRDTANLDAEVNLNNVSRSVGVLVDGVAPTVSSFTPANGALNVSGNTNLVINFNESVTKGTGNVTIRKTSDDSLVEAINVAGSNVTVTGSSVTIDPNVTLQGGTGYYVLIDAAAFRDIAGNYFAGISDKNAWNFTTSDFTPPSGYSVNIDQDYINNNNKTAMSFTFAGAETGATYNYTLTSSGGEGSLTGSGMITSANQQVMNVTTFGLNEGTLTLSVTLTDAAGNAGLPTTDTVVKDTLMPNGYSVSIDQTTINQENQTAMSFVISGAETGASYRYTVSSSGGGTEVSGSGTASGASQTVSGINTSSLNDGTLTLSLTMTDIPGNQGTAVTDTVVKETSAPTASSFSPADNATGVSTTTNLVINFTENIKKGTGNITIRKTADDSVVKVIDVTGTNVVVSGTTATINPAVMFGGETGYYIVIDAMAFTDAYDNAYPGIGNKTSWNFTTLTLINEAQIVSDTIPTTMTAGESYTVSVTVKNTGTTTWTKADNYKLGATVSPGTGFTVPTRALLAEGESIGPNQQKIFTFTIKASTKGSYTIGWRMLKEGVAQFGQTLTKTVTVTPVANDAQIVSDNIPTTMAAGQSYTVSVTVKNTGSATWTKADNYKLGRTVSPSAGLSVPSRALLAEGESIGPNQQKTFTFTITALSMGSYTIGWRMLKEGVVQFGQTLTKNITVTAPANDAQIVSDNIPTTMTAGQSYTVSVTVKNTGSATWTKADNYKLGRAVSPSAGLSVPSRALLAEGDSIGPNQQKTFTFTITASSVGSYTIGWRMLKEGVVQFGQTLTKTITVTAPANDAQIVSDNIPTTMTAGQSYMVSVTVKNTGTATWTKANNYKLGATVSPSTGLSVPTRVFLADADSIGPNQQKTFTFTITASATGSYTINLRMLKEGVAQFGQTLTKTVSVTAQPASKPEANASPSTM